VSNYRRSNNTNLLVGIFLLLLLAVLIGPGTLPRLLSSLVPNIDESIPCDWLREGINRAEHQSLIGRAAASPIGLRVKSSSVPNTPDGVLTISIILTNTSIGTVAILYDPAQVRIGDDGVTSGLGVVFNSPSPQSAGAPQGAVSYPENEIRLLGPRQSCVHKLEFSINQLPAANIATGSATVKAYYRNTSPGIVQNSNPQATPIYPDQGLWVGISESESAPIPLESGT
jgi:hypothetical protein